MRPQYPSAAEVAACEDREQLARWSRFLPIAEDEDEVKVSNLIFDKFKAFGGMNPAISKRLGWDI